MNNHSLKKLLIITIILSLLFNAGCWDLREINESAVPNCIGIDLGENKKINFSTLFIQPMAPGESGSSEIENIVTTTSDYSVAMAARRVLLSLCRVPEWPHAQNMVLGEKLVRNELPIIADFLIRNRNIPPNINLLIALQSPPEEFLAQVNSTTSNLKQLVVINEHLQGTYVPISLGDYIYKLMTPGIEPAVPQIIMEEIPAVKTAAAGGDKNKEKADNKNKRIVLHGTAVFKGQKMVGSLNETESRGYRWLNSHIRNGGLLLVKDPLQPQDYVALEICNFNSKTTPQLTNNTIKMHITVQARVKFYEATGNTELLTPPMLKKLEEAANQEISRQVKSCINKSQNYNSDILGWGLNLQQYQPDAWKILKKDWNALYPLIEYDVKVKTKITHSYLSNKSFRFR